MSAARLLLVVGCIAGGACANGSDVATGPDACGSSTAPTRLAAGLDTGVVVVGASTACLQIDGGAGDYLVSVQLGTSTLGFGGYAVDVARPGARVNAASSVVAPGAAPSAIPLAFEASLREAEQRWSRRSLGPQQRSLTTRALTRAVPVLGSIDTFQVIANLSPPYTYVKAPARLVYRGSRVLTYVDVNTPAVWTDADWAALGAHLEHPLYGIDTVAFGEPSDVDGNGRVIVLFSPRVNALVSQVDCARSGFVTGYFYAFDIASTAAESNQGEIFFSYVPDPSGVFSCPHSVAEVQRQLPATFVHELQHMISYGQHAVARGSIAEETWLNEGLSHLAEELAARFYEARYPAPMGRTSSAQLFPDSAGDFIMSNLANSYRWLLVPSAYSPVRYAAGSLGGLEERGASWLFSRWLVDRVGATATRSLVQTNRWGTANVEAVAGAPMKQLLADFGMAVWLDSVPGMPRPPLLSARRFRSRNLRELFAALLVARPGLGSGYPLAPLPLTSMRRATLRPGATEYFRLTVPTGGTRLAVRRPSGEATAVEWQVQVGVVRLNP